MSKNGAFCFMISALFVLSLNAQEDIHDCAIKHNGKLQFSGTKTLSLAEESEANKYDVTFYGLDLIMTNQNTNISGTASIHAKTINNLDSVVLELFPSMIISDLRLNGISTPYNRSNSVLKIPINSSANIPFIIEIDYAGTPPNPSNNPFGGSGVSSTYVSTIMDKVTFTVSCPFLAHEWFPCKQILRDKADSSSVKVTVPSNCKAGSNGILENIIDLGNGTTRYEWKHKSPILYYLICATIAPYSEYNVFAYPSQLVGDSILIQNYVYGNSTTLPQAKAQCDLLPGFLELFSELYGLYPFHTEKYGQCIAPLSGGMEHQTMTTIGVYEKKTTAHELAHSWWGDDIGIASFSDVWVSEGFATYSEYLMLENMYPNERAALLNVWHTSVLNGLGGSVWHTDTLNIARIYNSRLTYKKGASIIHTLRHIVNNDALFFQTLREFQVDFHNGVAVGLDVKDKFETITNINLTNFFQEWYFGEGHPTYSTRWNTENNNLMLEISQTSSMPSVTPIFTNPIEIKFTRLGMNDTIIRFDVNSSINQYLIPVNGTISSVSAIDPNNWIINKNGTNIFDSSLITIAEQITLSKDEQIFVFPNPMNESTTIKMTENGNYTLFLYDSNGKLILTYPFKDSTTLNAHELAIGSYILEVNSSSGKMPSIRRILKR
jgi:aminopeptidase N